MDEAYRTYRGVTSGAVSDVYPALSLVPPGLFGLCLTDVTGTRYAAGDAGNSRRASCRDGSGSACSAPIRRTRPPFPRPAANAPRPSGNSLGVPV